MKRKATRFFYSASAAATLLVLLFVFNQLEMAYAFIGSFNPYAQKAFLLCSTLIILSFCYTGLRLFSLPQKPALPENDKSRTMAAYAAYLAGRLPVHPMHPDPSKAQKDHRWLRSNLKLLDTDSLNLTREIATKNFFVGAFAQNTSYGTTTSLLNILKVLWNVYTIHNHKQYPREFITLVRTVYESLPLSDFKKEEIPEHIKPIIQSSFSNTLSSLLPGGNLLTPFFLNLFLAGATNTYLTCLAGIIATRYCQATTREEKNEVIQQSMFEASFMLKEIVRECNPILSVTISKAVKKAGIESLDTIQPPSTSSGMAQDIVSHLASSLKNMLKENG